MTTRTDLSYDGTSRFLETPQGRMHYHEAGDGPPLLLLHGSGPGVSGWSNFRGNIGTFSEQFRTIILDLPGFGASDPIEGHPAATAPDSVLRFLDGLGLQSVGILGNSMGGGVGSRVAANNAERVPRLAAIGGVGINLLSASPPEGIKLLVEFVEDPTRDRLITWMESMVFDRATLTDELVEERWQQAGNPVALESARQMYGRAAFSAMRAGMAGAASLEHLDRIQAPTLLAWGRDDRVTPVDMALAPMRLIPRCELHVFYDCGHWAMIERKLEFESVMLSFFGRGS